MQVATPSVSLRAPGRRFASWREKKVVLSVNILSSDYFKELYRLKTYHEVINVIYNQVDHVEQWMTGQLLWPLQRLLPPLQVLHHEAHG
uniref:Pre-mRNA-splicing factor 38 n=1 Tax=Oryza rufipogon TaxID=4529 RepID=A0A0E0QYC5_ORYRU